MTPPSGDDEIDVNRARRRLEDILQDEDALWTKITQTRLDEILKLHGEYAKGNLGGKLASFKFLDMSYLDLSRRNINQADFTGARCEYANISDTKLRAANFYAADLRFANLAGSDLARSDLRGACLRGTNLSYADLSEADLRDGLLMKSVHGELLPVMTDTGSSEADHAIMHETNLTGARVSNAYVVQTDLSDAILKDARFMRADLSHANFTGAELDGCDFTEANLTGAIFRGAILTRTVLDNAKLDGANFVGAIVDSVNIKGVEGAAARLPRHVAKLAGELQAIIAEHLRWVNTMGKHGLQANLSEVNLGGLDL